jgi:hypothetical protein
MLKLIICLISLLCTSLSIMSKCFNCFHVIQHVGMNVVLNVNTWLILEVEVITLDC